MDDKCLMENLLPTAKGVCDSYLHGITEFSIADVYQVFDNALNESLYLQNRTYKKMPARG